MLIYFNSTADELNLWNRDQVEELFVELISCSMKGYHDIHISRECCRWGLENLGLMERHAAHLKSILQKFATTAGVLDICPVMMSIKISNTELVSTDEGYEVGIRFVLVNDILNQPATLVVENSIYDGELYQLILNFCSVASQHKSYSMNIENGGGGNTASVFKSKIDQNRIVVAIVDSDKLSPHGSCGDTHRQVMGVHSTYSREYVGNAYTTLGREAENLLPTECVLTIIEQNIAFLGNLYLANKKVSDFSENSFWDYFDLKRGFNGTSFLASVVAPRGRDKSSVPCVIWWAEVFDVDPADIDRVNVPAAGQHLLSRFLNDDSAIAAFRKIMRTNAWQEKYLEYFTNILWYFCSSKRARA